MVATVSIGADPSNRIITVTATSGSLTANRVFAVTGATLTGTRLPAVVTPGSAGNRVDFRLIDANGQPMVGQAISVTAGSLGTTTGTTGINGDYSYVYTAPAAVGNLDVVATAGGVSNTQSVIVQSSAGSIPPVTAAILSASVSANPSVVSTNTAVTSNRTELRALFVGAEVLPAPTADFTQSPIQPSTVVRMASFVSPKARRRRLRDSPACTISPAATPVPNAVIGDPSKNPF